MADVDSAKEQLGIAWKALCNKWEGTKIVWNDPVSQSFERQYWGALERHSRGTLAEMEKLAQVINEAHRKVHEVRAGW